MPQSGESLVVVARIGCYRSGRFYLGNTNFILGVAYYHGGCFNKRASRRSFQAGPGHGLNGRAATMHKPTAKEERKGHLHEAKKMQTSPIL